MKKIKLNLIQSFAGIICCSRSLLFLLSVNNKGGVINDLGLKYIDNKWFVQNDNHHL